LATSKNQGKQRKRVSWGGLCKHRPRFRRQLDAVQVAELLLCVSLIGHEVILIRRKQQCSEAIPHSDNFAHSKVSDCLLIGVLSSLETLCNSEQLRFVVYGFPKLNRKRRPHFVSLVMAGAHCGYVYQIRRWRRLSKSRLQSLRQHIGIQDRLIACSS